MAAGLPEGGHIDTCEVAEEHAEVARRYIERSPYADRITIHMGPALETIERLGGEWDFVFVDADKENYANYYEALLPRLGPSGLMAIDNTLWSGRVLDGDDDSPATRAIRELNDRIAADDRVVAVQLTVRDGVTLIRRYARVDPNAARLQCGPLGAIAQLGERLDRTQEVAGSSPASSISKPLLSRGFLLHPKIVAFIDQRRAPGSGSPTLVVPRPRADPNSSSPNTAVRRSS